MNQKEILEIIRKYRQNAPAEYGILRLGVFGSVARDQFSEDSDVDVVVEIAKPALFTLIGIMQELEEQLGRSVDIVRYRANLNPKLKTRIDREAIYV
jgi:predicted nucleotidyltransferase